MAEKKATTTKKKTTEKKQTTQAAQTLPDLQPTGVYKFKANGKNGLEKDKVWTVGGVIATALLEKGLGELID